MPRNSAARRIAAGAGVLQGYTNQADRVKARNGNMLDRASEKGRLQLSCRDSSRRHKSPSPSSHTRQLLTVISTVMLAASVSSLRWSNVHSDGIWRVGVGSATRQVWMIPRLRRGGWLALPRPGASRTGCATQTYDPRSPQAMRGRSQPSERGQTVENQLHPLQEAAKRFGWSVVAVFRDEGISGATGRAKRPGLDALLKGLASREFNIVAAWSVCRLGRSLSDLIGLLGELRSRDIDLYLHQQALDTSTPSGRMLFGMLGVFSEFKRRSSAIG